MDRKDRAAWFDEALGLMRRLWSEDRVTHRGERFHIEDVALRPKPVQQPIEVWLGGQAPSELRRVGRLGDGWLPSFCTVDDVATGWAAVTAAAEAQGRAIDPEHLGTLVTYSYADIPDRVRELLALRRPDLDPSDVIPIGLDALRTRLVELTSVGASKFVVVPLEEPADWTAELAAVMDALGDLQN
ncbi:LLM class flavin-dependent oxidoreductase [Aquihabitans daechungensis]|uniref:LLM class flavin-dependent oxidoreductase n=1 Tax=Aquihabitans daechungensis TaxID=1052257 RepID=UPI003B9E9F8F